MNGEWQNESKWKCRTYSYLELGIRYSPEVVPAVASRRLKHWVTGSPALLERLAETGWTPTQRILTPRQVACIVEFLGEP